MSEDTKYQNLYKELKRRIRDVEEKNDTLNVRLYKARKNIKLLKLERTFLLDRMDKLQIPANALESDHSDSGLDMDTSDDTFLHKPAKLSKGRVEKMLPKQARRKKDPNAPKGPGNVYFLFCRLEREKIKGEHPAENPNEVKRLLGQKWKSLSKEEKQKYYDMYKKEMVEHEEAMKSYSTGTTAFGSAAPLASSSASVTHSQASQDGTQISVGGDMGQDDDVEADDEDDMYGDQPDLQSAPTQSPMESVPSATGPPAFTSFSINVVETPPPSDRESNPAYPVPWPPSDNPRS